MSGATQSRASLRGALFLLCGLALFLFTADPPHSRVGVTHETAQIEHVVDGDTVILNDQRHVRLIGINCPEIGRDGSQDQPLAHAARSMLQRLTEKKRVRLLLEHERHDRYQRLLAHIELNDGRNVQEELLRVGLCFAVAIPPNLEKLTQYFAAEQQARTHHRGVWAHPFYAPIEAEKLASSQTGFRLVRGTLSNLRQRRSAVYLDLAPQFSLRIPHKAWHYFPGRPEQLNGRKVEVRGWITSVKDRLRIQIRHPAMLRHMN